MKNLEKELKELVAQEREILHLIVEKIRAIDEESLYLQRGYPSLFEYLTCEIGYSHASAQRRIDAARLSREIPEVIESLRTGALNLVQVGEAQKGFRRASVTIEEKREVLEQIMSAPAAESAQVVARELELPLIARAQSRGQADGSVRLSVTLSAEAAENLARVKEELSHVVPDGDTAKILERLLAQYVKKKVTSTVEVDPRQKTIPAQTRREIFARDKCCQFKAADGKICGSRYQLQIDHRQMRYHGGTHEPENLRLLCGKHNRWVAERLMKGEPEH